MPQPGYLRPLPAHSPWEGQLSKVLGSLPLPQAARASPSPPANLGIRPAISSGFTSPPARPQPGIPRDWLPADALSGHALPWRALGGAGLGPLSPPSPLVPASSGVCWRLPASRAEHQPQHPVGDCCQGSPQGWLSDWLDAAVKSLSAPPLEASVGRGGAPRPEAERRGLRKERGFLWGSFLRPLRIVGPAIHSSLWFFL